MKTNRTIVGFCLAIAFQFAILLGMVGSSALPLYTGVDIVLKTRPVDPRSLFRGNYARLSYDISVIDAALLPDVNLRSGEKIYVSLSENSEGVHELSAVSLEKPMNGVFIAGRVLFRSNWTSRSSIQVNYGIEAFFAPPEEALEIEVSLRNSKAIALVSVSGSGAARIREVREQ